MLNRITTRSKAKSSNAVQKKLVGTWILQSFINRSQEGNNKFPFGENPVGQLYYDESGHVGVHIMRAQRRRIHSPTHYEATPDESKEIVNDFFGYCGTYDVDPTEQLVRHHLEAHISPNNVGDEFVRRYRFYGEGDNQLSLTMKNDPNKELTWKKISSSMDSTCAEKHSSKDNAIRRIIKAKAP